MSKQITCLACGHTHIGVFLESVGEFTMFQCPNCGLQFSDPMSNSSDDYDSSYSGDCDRFKKPYSASLEMNRELIKKGQYLDYYENKRMVFKHIQNTFPKGSPILDLGCGAGGFLVALKNAGFAPMGMDVALTPIDLLRQDGYEVEQGTLEDYPKTWPDPKAVLMIDVLEHLPNPVETLIDMRTRFPDATLLLTVPNPHRIQLKYGPSIGDRPPNHLTRWTQPALSEALKSAGYVGTVHSSPLRGDMLKLPFEDSVIGGLVRFRDQHAPGSDNSSAELNGQATKKSRLNPLSLSRKLLYWYVSRRGMRDYRLAKTVTLYPVAWCYGRAGYTGRSLVAIGNPDGNSVKLN